VGSNGGNGNGNVETATSWCGQGGEFLSGEQVEDFVSGVLLGKRDLFRLEYDISVACKSSEALALITRGLVGSQQCPDWA